MPRFRKKPVEIEAVQWTGDNIMELVEFLGFAPHWDDGQQSIRIPTLEGAMTASKGDWVIRGVRDEVYPCKPDIFEATYEEALGRAEDTRQHTRKNDGE